MKNAWYGVICFFLVGAACGGGSGTGGEGASQAAQTAMTNSYETFGAVLESAQVAPCMSQAQTACTCPEGGSVAVSGTTTTFTSCTAAAGSAMVVGKATSTNRVFTGSLTSADGTASSGTLPVFGDCTNATGTNILMSSCGGTLSATCAMESVTGTIVDKSGGGCTLEYASGGGGTTESLDAARTLLLYQINEGGELQTKILEALLANLGTCAGGQVPVNATVGCTGGGTVLVQGTVNCTFDLGTMTYTISSIDNGTLTGTSCASASVAGGTTYNITQSTTNAVVTMTNTTMNVTANPPTLTGAATLAFSPMTLGGDVTATITYTQQLTFTNFTPGTNNPTCGATSASVTEGGKTGTCTIAADCTTCT